MLIEWIANCIADDAISVALQFVKNQMPYFKKNHT